MEESYHCCRSVFRNFLSGTALLALEMWKLKEMHHPNPFPDNEQNGYPDPWG
jgi:hypothetical protein